MGRRTAKPNLLSKKNLDGLFPSILFSIVFFTGLICGFLLALLNSQNEMLIAYLQQYLYSLGEGRAVTFTLWSVIWDVFQWPLLLFCLGATQFCFIAVPAALFIRAFLLSYAISIFVRLFAGKGFLIALVSFGLMALLVVPVLFVIAFNGTEFAVRRNYGNSNIFEFSRERLAVFLLCFGILILAVFIQWTIMPPLLTLICAGL